MMMMVASIMIMVIMMMTRMVIVMMRMVMIAPMMIRRFFIQIWSFQNSMMPSGEKSRVGSSVVVEQVSISVIMIFDDSAVDQKWWWWLSWWSYQVSRHDAGVYVCSAENGVGKPASAQISLQVLCKLKMVTMMMILDFWKDHEDDHDDRYDTGGLWLWR